MLLYLRKNRIMSKIMTIGNATLDIIIAMDGYPVEDKKHLALGQRIQRGGNASNTSEVLAQLGHDVSLVVPLADDDASNAIRHSLDRRGARGAYGQLPNQDVVHSPAFDFGELVVTTIGTYWVNFNHIRSILC